MANLFRCGSNQNSNLGGKLLWTNPSPNAAFAAQTLSMDLSKYNIIIVISNYAYNISKADIVILNKNEWNCLIAERADGNGTAYRGISKCTDTEIVISGGGVIENGSNISNNLYCIPYKIYGINLSL